jgi:hypothetical protein
MKKIILLLLVFLSVKVFAQSSTDGIYNTSFGKISLTFETGYEYPNAGIVYGDYKDNGTLTGSTQNNAVELQGSFHNGAAEGKFIFLCPGNKTSFFDQGINSFNGFWGYGTDNKYSDNPSFKWNVLSKISGKETIKNTTNVWSGKWNTTDGNLILLQVGNKVTGTYKGIGTIDAVYYKESRKLKGKFINSSTQQAGYFEFTFNGNTFTGKWGWTKALADGEWNGTKHVKNNKELPKLGSNTTAPPATTTATTTTTPNQLVTNLKKASDVTYECQLDYLRGGYSQDIYGIGWIRLFIKNKNTGKVDMVKPHLFNYLDKHGRVFEIPKEKAVNNAIKSLMPAPIRFKFNPNDYGYNSLDEMKGEAYFEFIFEVKIDGILSDEIAGKKSVRTYIENANIRRRDLSETILLSAEPGFFEIEYGDEDYGIYYSVKKVN